MKKSILSIGSLVAIAAPVAAVVACGADEESLPTDSFITKRELNHVTFLVKVNGSIDEEKTIKAMASVVKPGDTEIKVQFANWETLAEGDETPSVVYGSKSFPIVVDTTGQVDFAKSIEITVRKAFLDSKTEASSDKTLVDCFEVARSW